MKLATVAPAGWKVAAGRIEGDEIGAEAVIAGFAVRNREGLR
jgi:hypothetical protein